MATREPALPYIGYRPLRPGCIHMYCKGCGRKISNVPREPGYDPPSAVLIQTWCDKESCSGGCKDVPSYFLDAYGRRVEPIC